MHLPPLTPLIIIILLLISLLPLSTLAARSTATSFCKCICFNNSTIIALNPSSSSSPPFPTTPTTPTTLPRTPDAESTTPNKHHTLTCADCNRAFCLSYNLPICKDATDADVFTTCFQRDSLKDETVVIMFIFATAGLLGWALIRPWVDKLKERRYLPIGSEANAPLRLSQG